MSVAIALAVPDLSCESQLITAANSCGINVLRRCVDAADLLGACLGAPGLVAVITAGLPRLSAEVIDRLRASSTRVVGVVIASADRVALQALGVDVLVEHDDDPSRLLSSIAKACEEGSAPRGVWNLADVPPEPAAVRDKGRLIAVWGPAGAPGRTTTALVIARHLAEHSLTAIIDADTAAPSVALHLGLVDDLSGLIVACRHADAGSLSSRALLSSMSQIREKYFALTGIAHARRRVELRPGALSRVLERVRSDFDYGVIDLGSALDQGTSGMSSAASFSEVSFARADIVVAVCQAEPLGVARFLADLPELAGHGVPVAAVITGGTQRDQAKELIREAAGRLGVSIPIADLSLDPDSLSRSLRRGPLLRSRRFGRQRVGTPASLLELVA